MNETLVAKKQYPTIEGKRYVMVAREKEHDKNGYIPCVVMEGTAGYRVMSGNGEGAAPWYWGKTFGECKTHCYNYNVERLGYTDEEIVAILNSSRNEEVRLLEISHGLGRHPMIEQYMNNPTPDNWFAIRDFMLQESSPRVVVRLCDGKVTDVYSDTRGIVALSMEESSTTHFRDDAVEFAIRGEDVEAILTEHEVEYSPLIVDTVQEALP